MGAGFGVGVGVGVGLGVAIGGDGAGAGPRAVPFGTGALRTGTFVGAVGVVDSVCPQAAAATSATTAKNPRPQISLIRGMTIGLSLNSVITKIAKRSRRADYARRTPDRHMGLNLHMRRAG